MTFDPAAYGPKVASILALDGSGERLMPLAKGTCSSQEAAAVMRKSPARELFSMSRAAEAAFSGLWLYFSCLDESHTLSQEIETPDGSFWHAIMHRQEPDAGNSGYWFRRAGNHPTFPWIAEAAVELAAFMPGAGFQCRSKWDPLAFIDFCEQARRKPGSETEKLALLIQRAEWQILFDHCAGAG